MCILWCKMHFFCKSASPQKCTSKMHIQMAHFKKCTSPNPPPKPKPNSQILNYRFVSVGLGYPSMSVTYCYKGETFWKLAYVMCILWCAFWPWWCAFWPWGVCGWISLHNDRCFFQKKRKAVSCLSFLDSFPSYSLLVSILVSIPFCYSIMWMF